MATMILRHCLFGLIAAAGVLCGCTRITVAPDCPEVVEVGEAVELAANERNPGAIATYQWEVVPADAGTFDDADSKDVSFEGDNSGEAVIRLTASDGLFVSIAECRVRIGSEGLAVQLAADPGGGAVDDEFTLTCTSTGQAEATTLIIDQLDGPPVDLLDEGPGVSTFAPESVGEYTFRCVGRSTSGEQSAPSVVTVNVARSGGGRPPRG